MEGTKKTLDVSRGLIVVTLLGVIGIAASPFTMMLTPMYPIYHIHSYEEEFVLNDDFSTFEFWQPFADKTAIEELTTNGTPVVIMMYESYFSNTPNTILQNVTHIEGIYLAGAHSESSGAAVIRIYRQDNQSVEVNLAFRSWFAYASTDNLIGGPSIFLFLAIPLVYSIFKHRGHTPTKRGYVILFLVVLSALLVFPILVYNYNGWGTILRHDEVQTVQTRSFTLNVSDPIQEFNMTIESLDSAMFSRINNINTYGIPVAITILPIGDGAILELTNITTFSQNVLQFEFPRETVSEYTVQLSRIAQNTTVSLSLESVKDVWAPWRDPIPYYVSAFIGLVIFGTLLVVPQKSEHVSTTQQS